MRSPHDIKGTVGRSEIWGSIGSERHVIATNLKLNCSSSILVIISILMYREQLSISSLTAWVRLNSVQLNGVKIASFEDSRGLGVVTTEELSEDNAILMTVPRELLLSLENVWLYAKSDGRLREVLQAAGEYARVRQIFKGHIILF